MKKTQKIGRAKHRSDLVFCGCSACNHGMHKGMGGRQVQQARRQFRRVVKEALRKQEIPPKRWPVGYTD